MRFILLHQIDRIRSNHWLFIWFLVESMAFFIIKNFYTMIKSIWLKRHLTVVQNCQFVYFEWYPNTNILVARMGTNLNGKYLGKTVKRKTHRHGLRNSQISYINWVVFKSQLFIMVRNVYVINLRGRLFCLSL